MPKPTNLFPLGAKLFNLRRHACAEIAQDQKGDHAGEGKNENYDAKVFHHISSLGGWGGATA
jgi:hypothetical protein